MIFLDEATQLREEWMRQFAACLRGVNDYPKRIYYTCNPGGRGMDTLSGCLLTGGFRPGKTGRTMCLSRHG